MAMTTKTPQQIHNLREALEVWWPSVPEANVSRRLSNFTANGKGSETDCGTVACFVGWAIRWPAIARQGFGMTHGVPVWRGSPTWGCTLAASEGCRALFGDSGLWRMRGEHPADEGFTGSDHELVTNRLRWALEH